MLTTTAIPSWFSAAVRSAADEGVVLVEGAFIAYRAWGDPRNHGVVLVHGGAAHSRWWDHIAPLIADQGYRVVALDLSGHGDSARRETYNLDLWAAEVMAVSQAAGMTGTSTVIGHSMGGFVALKTSMLFGSGIAGTIVIDSPLRELTIEESAFVASIPVEPHRLHSTFDAAMKRFRPVPDQPVQDYIAAYVASHSVHSVTGGWAWKFDPGVALRGHLPPSTIRVPRHRLAFIRGERGLLSRGMVHAMFDTLGGPAADVEIPDSGHHIMLDRPLALVSALRALLAAWAYPDYSSAAVTGGGR